MPPGSDDFSAFIVEWIFGGHNMADKIMIPSLQFDDTNNWFAGADDFLFIVVGLNCMLLGKIVKIRFADQIFRRCNSKVLCHVLI